MRLIGGGQCQVKVSILTDINLELDLDLSSIISTEMFVGLFNLKLESLGQIFVQKKFVQTNLYILFHSDSTFDILTINQCL